MDQRVEKINDVATKYEKNRKRATFIADNMKYGYKFDPTEAGCLVDNMIAYATDVRLTALHIIRGLLAEIKGLRDEIVAAQERIADLEEQLYQARCD